MPNVQSHQGTASDKVLAVYDRMLAMRAIDNQLFDIGAMTKTIKGKSNSKVNYVIRYKNMLPATTPLAEYDGTNIKDANKIVREEITYDVAHYGDYVRVTDELNLYDYDDIKSSYTDILADQAALTSDTLIRNELRGSTNIVYAGDKTSKAEVAATSEKLTKEDFKLISLKLKNQRATRFKKVIAGTDKVGTTPIGAAFLCIASPAVIEDMKDLTGPGWWKAVEDYSDYSKAMPDEAGKCGDFRILESTNNEPIDEDGTNLYYSYFFGENAYATTTFRGKKKIEAIVKEIGSAGADDPLNQYGSFGWKMIMGAAIINQAWLVTTLSTASLDDTAEKHYMDYSV